MGYLEYLDMYVWVEDNLDITTSSITPQWLSRWKFLEKADPAIFEEIASFGYYKSQHDLHGRKQIMQHELKDFLRQFRTKIRLAQLKAGRAPQSLPMFEVCEMPPESKICWC